LKTILYLDQNYVSHLTKARLGVKVHLAASGPCPLNPRCPSLQAGVVSTHPLFRSSIR